MKQVDRERVNYLDAIEKEKRALQKQEDLARLLSRQIRLKELFEDKLKDTLDMKV